MWRPVRRTTRRTTKRRGATDVEELTTTGGPGIEADVFDNIAEVPDLPPQAPQLVVPVLAGGRALIRRGQLAPQLLDVPPQFPDLAGRSRRRQSRGITLPDRPIRSGPSSKRQVVRQVTSELEHRGVLVGRQPREPSVVGIVAQGYRQQSC